jgi:hypothetical protein
MSDLLRRMRNAKELWNALISSCDPPDGRQLALWVSRFDDAFIERAFWRASRKFSPDKGQFVPEIIYRYCTGVMLNEERDRQTLLHGVQVGARSL